MNSFKVRAYSMFLAPILISGTLTTTDNYKIAYHHYKNGHNNVVIIAPGFYNSKDAVLLQKLKDGLIDSYDVIIFDFRGHGQSSGLFYWTSKEELDLEAILDYAGKSYHRIGLIAFSLGAATSINLLPKTDSVNTFVAVSAPGDFNKIDYKFWNLDFKNDVLYTFVKEGRKGKGVRPGPFWFKKLKPIDGAGKIKCPVLYIHGDKDWIIGWKNSQELYDKTKTKKEINIIKGGPHAEYLLKDNEQELIGLIRSWLETTITGGGER